MKLHDKQRRLLQALLEKTEARTPRGCAGPAMTVRTHLVLAGPPVPPAGSAAAAEEEEAAEVEYGAEEEDGYADDMADDEEGDYN